MSATPGQLADGLADYIAELLNDHPDAYLSIATDGQEVTTSANGPAEPGMPVRVELTDEQGDAHRFLVRVTPDR